MTGTQKAAIAELLRAGATYPEVRAAMGGGCYRTIARIRQTQNIPTPDHPRPRRDIEHTYALYAQPYGDGHARWTGPWAGRMPQIQHPGKHGRKESALRVAFRMRHDREPAGYVRPGCGEPACVASGHLTDRTMRHQLKEAAAMKVRTDVAAMLRAGATMTEIKQHLGVSNQTIIATRRALNIPVPPERAKRTRAQLSAIEEQAVAMLRDGATYDQIHQALGLGRNRISTLRKTHHIPVPQRDPQAATRRTLTQAFTLHTQPTPGGHLIWTGPRAGRALQLVASGQKHNPRTVAFEQHHGRAPEGRLRRTCDQPDCIAGAHLTDHRIRTAHHHADRAYTAIFGKQPP